MVEATETPIKNTEQTQNDARPNNDNLLQKTIIIFIERVFTPKMVFSAACGLAVIIIGYILGKHIESTITDVTTDKAVDFGIKVLETLLKKNGPIPILLLAGWIWLLNWVRSGWAGRLADKDKEIERLVAVRNKLLDQLEAKHCTSGKR